MTCCISRRPAYRINTWLISLVCLCSYGCGGGEDTGPPTLHLGSDVCDYCKMIISDQKFAAACIVRATDGRVRSAAFDDIGCLLEYQGSSVEGTIEYLYVTDYDSGVWMDATEAFYIQSPEIRSPMASGIIASQTQADAGRLADRFEGAVLRFNKLGGLADTSTPANLTKEISPTTDTQPTGGDEATLETPK